MRLRSRLSTATLVTGAAAASVLVLGPAPVAVSATPRTVASCTARQLIGNPGFETGSTSPWTASGGAGVVSGTAHSGSYSVVLGGLEGTTQTLSLTVTIPSGCTSAVLSFWLHIVTDETTTTTAYDKLTLKVGSTTLRTWSNLNASAGWTQYSVNLAGFAGQAVTIAFTATNDYSLPTWFYLDDIALNVS